MIEKISKEIDSLKEDLIDDLRKVISIPSIKSNPIGDAPYGEECKKVLNLAMDIAYEKGFYTKNIDNHMAYASLGEGDDYVCAMGHLDVVEEMKGWDFPPFGGEIVNNKMYSRGALDNKGPIIAAFYGLYALKNLGVKFNTEFRIVFGSDEESGMSDLKYYLSKEDPPSMGFTPDNKFPAIYGERARAKVEITGDYSKVVKFTNDYLLKGDPVDNLGIGFVDENFGKMILRGIQLLDNEDKYGVGFSLSAPVCDIEEVLEKIENKACGLKVDLVSYTDAFLHDKNSPLVKILNDSYNEFMGENEEITTTTGMTYAHFCPNIIPFGPSFKGQKAIAHLPNEWMDIEDLMKCAKIYAYAFYRLNEYKGGKFE